MENIDPPRERRNLEEGGGISRNEIFRFSEDIVFDVSKRYENELTSTINSSIDLIDLHPFAHN